MKKNYFLGASLCLLIGGTMNAQAGKSIPSTRIAKTSAVQADADSTISIWYLGTEDEMKFKVTYQWAAPGLKEEEKQWQWNKNAEKWDETVATTYTYDENGRTTQMEESMSGQKRYRHIITWKGNIGLGDIIPYDNSSDIPQKSFQEINDKGQQIHYWVSNGKKGNDNYESWKFVKKNNYEYDEQGRITKSEIIMYNDQGEQTWLRQATYVYEENAKVVTYFTQSGGSTYTSTERQEKEGSNPVAWVSYGDNGQPESIDYEYYPIGSNGSANSFLGSNNNAPVESGDAGSFDIAVNIPFAAVTEASFSVNLPEGITLDSEQTALADGSSPFTLSIEKQESNKWGFKLSSKNSPATRAAVENNAKTVSVRLAYNVDGKLANGNYKASVGDLCYTTTGGSFVYGVEALEIPVVINRDPTAIKETQYHGVRVSCSGQTLTIDSPANETIHVYDLSGRLVLQHTKPAGKATVTLPNLSGVMTVKGGTNWVERILVK